MEVKLTDLEKVIDEAEKLAFGKITPTKEQVDDIFKIVVKFIKDNNLIVYGGMGLHYLELSKGRKLYSDFDRASNLPDIEFYSPKPIEHMFQICDLLYDAGYSAITGREAVHEETYSINFFTYGICDISYMPQHINNTIPFIKKDFKIIDPSVMLVDFYRIRSDPLLASNRLEKTFIRQEVLEKHLTGFLKNLSWNYDDSSILKPVKKQNINSDVQKVLSTIKDKVIQDNREILLAGKFAIECMLKKAKSEKIKKVAKELLTQDCFEIYCLNIHQTLSDIKKEWPLDQEKLIIKEYTPFFQFLPRSVSVQVGSNKICIRLYQIENKCAPFQLRNDNKYQLASIDQIYKFWLSERIRSIVNRKDNQLKEAERIIRILRQCQKIETPTSKSRLEEGPFQILRLTCLGKEMMDARVERHFKIQKKKEKKKPLVFNYFPNDGKRKPPDYKFANTSGNLVINDKGLKIINKI